MKSLKEIKLRTNCHHCVHKCCSQPYDWVYLTESEIDRLKFESKVPQERFVITRLNPNTGHSFRTLGLPCPFLDPPTGRCKVYAARPLICRMFPFYPEPLTGHATLLPIQCGTNLEFVGPGTEGGWSLSDFEVEIRDWLRQIWEEARHRGGTNSTSIARADGSP